jgi:hypothetical protein
MKSLNLLIPDKHTLIEILRAAFFYFAVCFIRAVLSVYFNFSFTLPFEPIFVFMLSPFAIVKFHRSLSTFHKAF